MPSARGGPAGRREGPGQKIVLKIPPCNGVRTRAPLAVNNPPLSRPCVAQYYCVPQCTTEYCVLQCTTEYYYVLLCTSYYVLLRTTMYYYALD